MELDAESIRTLNRLPPHAKHCLRYRASQLTVMREVEMRLSPPDPDEKTLRIFQDEGRELSLLDAPWFLPVLEAGTFRDRPFYLVPLRRYPSLAEAIEDPRFGRQPSSASFCNADDALLPGADLWLHGHVHCRHDYTVCHAGGRRTRVVCQSRGNASKGEAAGFDPLRVIEA